MTQKQRNLRKSKQGIVYSIKMDKTIIVKIERKLRHPVYEKVIRMTKKYYVHDENNTCKVGDRVTIMETRPISKLKRWRVVAEA